MSATGATTTSPAAATARVPVGCARPAPRAGGCAADRPAARAASRNHRRRHGRAAGAHAWPAPAPPRPRGLRGGRPGWRGRRAAWQRVGRGGAAQRPGAGGTGAVRSLAVARDAGLGLAAAGMAAAGMAAVGMAAVGMAAVSTGTFGIGTVGFASVALALARHRRLRHRAAVVDGAVQPLHVPIQQGRRHRPGLAQRLRPQDIELLRIGRQLQPAQVAQRAVDDGVSADVEQPQVGIARQRLQRGKTRHMAQRDVQHRMGHPAGLLGQGQCRKAGAVEQSVAVGVQHGGLGIDGAQRRARIGQAGVRRRAVHIPVVRPQRQPAGGRRKFHPLLHRPRATVQQQAGPQRGGILQARRAFDAIHARRAFDILQARRPHGAGHSAAMPGCPAPGSPGRAPARAATATPWPASAPRAPAAGCCRACRATAQ